MRAAIKSARFWAVIALAAAALATVVVWKRATRSEDEDEEESNLPTILTLNLGQDRRNLLAMVYSPDGKALACGTTYFGRTSGKGSLTVWDVGTGKEGISLQPLHDTYTIAYSSDGKLLACGEGDKLVRVFDTPTWKTRTRLRAGGDGDNRLAFSPDGATLAVARRNVLALWDIATDKRTRVLTHQLFAVEGLAFSPDGKTLVCVGTRGPFVVWDVANGNERWSADGHVVHTVNVVSSVAFAPDGESFATGGGDGTVKVWDVSSGGNRLVLKVNKRTRGPVTSVCYSPDGKLLAAANGPFPDLPGRVYIWDAATGKRVAGQATQCGVHCLQFSPDGTRLAVGQASYETSFVELWGLEELLERLKATPGHP
jgi:WD40 repeat protein